MQSVPAGPAGVDHLIGMLKSGGRRAHGAGGGGDLAHGLAAQAHSGDRRRDLGGRRLAAQAGGEEIVGVGLRQGRAVGETGQ